ncbi:DeoR/GlpR family DNA-binding transcription regulator [Labrys neptuniae]|uniref:DeoR/GlpR family DNA-binding transcription regulator n=1 Tax=Labrys neptuniae TaxID=376174 RepID=UPI0028907A91|nr:DeoR/GlpR family DNA-binding transcription regulator [Labrys neptuniae]MDT3378229.1 DeoR/GlpR family DNA-binding transcription regulator [Labrys neptuniae]
MTSTRATQDETLEQIIADQVPSDSRHARQLARRQLIMQAVMAEGTMRIEELAERFAISLMTVHRDLDELINRGLLRKSRGIVSATPTSLVESSDVYRSMRQAVEKRAIAQVASQFLEAGQAVFFDDSTTVLQMAPHIAARVPLTAITNSIPLMNELKEMNDVTLLGLGGRYYNWCNAFMGPATTAEIRRLRADCVFLSMSAITDDMVFHQSAEMVETKRAMFDSAAKRILLADHTKFQRRALHAMGNLSEFDAIIVDDGMAPLQVELLRSRGINIVIAPLKQRSSHPA